MRRATSVVGDVSALPDDNVGPNSLGWWSVIGLLLIEAMGVALAIGAYFFLVPFVHGPDGSLVPPLHWGTAFLALAILGELPNLWTQRVAHARQAVAVRRGLLVMGVLGLALLGLRGFELAAMRIRWDLDAYGSIVWALLLLHTTVITTVVFRTLVLAVLVWMKRADGRRFSDVSGNALHWHFICGSWVLIYLVIYWTPRWP
jgi:heme/copper-type cytochrome/quinol oxidase subunit 3